jgi:small nuclear ribonucleoprotein (snRNP)-like protein
MSDECAAGRVLVMTSDGRCYVGLLKACDQATNLVLDQAEERIYSIDVRVNSVTSYGYCI